MGKGLNALYGLSGMAARSARRSVRRQRAYQKLMIKAEIREEKLKKAQEVLDEANGLFKDYNSQIRFLTNLHLDPVEETDWSKVRDMPAPIIPQKESLFERIAKDKFDNYRPNLFIVLFRRVEKVKSKLKAKIEVAEMQDEEKYNRLISEYEAKYNNWKSNVSLAEKILSKNKKAYESVIQQKLQSLSNKGIPVVLKIAESDSALSKFVIKINSKKNIPEESVSLLKSGKASIKPIPSLKYNSIHKDHMLSLVFRVAKEVFCLLPIDMLHLVVKEYVSTSSSGADKFVPVFEIVFSRSEFTKLDMETVIISDEINNFRHCIKFKKSAGFTTIPLSL
jgi:deoxyadenosine/deoxycytidine kinase